VNNTAYNYTKVKFDILGYQNNILKYVNQYLAENLYSGETRRISLGYSDVLNSGYGIKIIPRINILSPDSYFQIRGGVGQSK
jgi:hypothetical protein